MNTEQTIIAETSSVERIPSVIPLWKKWALGGFLIGIALVLLFVGLFLFLSLQPRSEAEVVKEDIVRIGLSLDTVKIQRWAEERDFMITKAEELGATVTVFSAENDDDVQITQIENLISQDVDAIIVVAHDAEIIGPTLTKAQEAGIKVINYDRLTTNGTPDLYVSFDSTRVGEYQAQYVIDALDPKNVLNIAYVGGSPTDNNAYLVRNGSMTILEPLIAEGRITLVYDKFTADWSPSEGYSNFKQFLEEGGNVDGVVVANDGLAYGVIQALTERGLAGVVPVSGQDGELQAIQRIVKGTQTMSVWKPGKLLAEQAIEAAVAFARGEKPTINGTVNNGIADIPTYLFDPIAVTKDNVESIMVESGAYTKAQLGL